MILEKSINIVIYILLFSIIFHMILTNISPKYNELLMYLKKNFFDYETEFFSNNEESDFNVANDELDNGMNDVSDFNVAKDEITKNNDVADTDTDNDDNKKPPYEEIKNQHDKQNNIIYANDEQKNNEQKNNDYEGKTCCGSSVMPGTDSYNGEIGEYLNNTLIGQQHFCGDISPNNWIIDDEKIKMERDKFFNFNNCINNNSNPNNTSLKISKLYNQNNTDSPISQIYDNAVKHNNLYNKNCIRMPVYDNLTKSGSYFTEGGNGKMYTSDIWMYDNEKIINGGQMDDNLYPNDPSIDGYAKIN